MKFKRELPNSNLSLNGFGMDINGNSIVTLSYPNTRGFSIQMANVLKNTHHISRQLLNGLAGLTDTELSTIEKECIAYITKYGSKLQKERLRTY